MGSGIVPTLCRNDPPIMITAKNELRVDLYGLGWVDWSAKIIEVD